MNVMNIQMIIPVFVTDTSLKGHVVSVVISRTNTLPLSYVTFRDYDLVNDLKRFAVLYNLRLNLTYLTSSLLYLLLTF